MPTPLGNPTWDEIDNFEALIVSLLAAYKTAGQFHGGDIAYADPLMAKVGMADAPSDFKAEYCKSLDRRLNFKGNTRSDFGAHAVPDTDRKDGMGRLFHFD